MKAVIFFIYYIEEISCKYLSVIGKSFVLETSMSKDFVQHIMGFKSNAKANFKVK